MLLRHVAFLALAVSNVVFASDAVDAYAPEPAEPSGDITFDWKDVPIAIVVQTVLGDIHGAAFEIAPGVEGNVTYTTPRPVGRWEALALLEQQLAAHGAVLVDTGRGYLVQPVADAGE